DLILKGSQVEHLSIIDLTIEPLLAQLGSTNRIEIRATRFDLSEVKFKRADLAGVWLKSDMIQSWSKKKILEKCRGIVFAYGARKEDLFSSGDFYHFSEHLLLIYTGAEVGRNWS